MSNGSKIFAIVFSIVSFGLGATFIIVGIECLKHMSVQ